MTAGCHTRFRRSIVIGRDAFLVNAHSQRGSYAQVFEDIFIWPRALVLCCVDLQIAQ